MARRTFFVGVVSFLLIVGLVTFLLQEDANIRPSAAISKQDLMQELKAAFSDTNALRALVAIPVSAGHLQQIEATVETLLGSNSQVHLWLFVAEAVEIPSLNDWRQNRRVQVWRVPAGMTKLDIARKHLPPKSVLGFDFLFLWDDDVVLPVGWDISNYMATTKEAQLGISQPSMASITAAATMHNSEQMLQDLGPAGATWAPVPYVDLSFIVFSLETWREVHQQFLSSNSSFDACLSFLPFQCLPSLKTSVGVVRLPIDQVSIEPIDQLQHDTEALISQRRAAQNLVSCAGCCTFITEKEQGYSTNHCFPRQWECPACSSLDLKSHRNALSRFLKQR